MIDSISSYLYSKAIDSKNTEQNISNTQKTEGRDDFASLLNKNLTDLSDMNDLKEVLDGSVLGSFNPSTKDLALLSEDLLNTGSGRKVISQLAEGHLNSIVMTDNSKSEETKSITSNLDTYTESVKETSDLEEIVNQMATLIEHKEEK